MKKFLLVLGTLLVSVLLFSCNTPKVAEDDLPEVNPLALIDQDLSIYVYVPVQAHKELVTDIMQAEIPSISKKDAMRIVEQLDELYAGLGTVKDRSKLQMATTGDFPKAAIKLLLTEKNGWTSYDYSAPSSQSALQMNYPNKFKVYSTQETKYNMSFCSQGLMTFAAELEPMLDLYALRPNPPATPYADFLIQKAAVFGKAGLKNILFYISRPGQYVKSMVGADITFGMKDSYGYLEYVPDPKNPEVYSNYYSLNLYITLDKSNQMRALISALRLAMGLMGGEVIQFDENTILIKNMEVNEKDVIDLFTRDPVTGKHFKVDGDSIIKESKNK